MTSFMLFADGDRETNRTILMAILHEYIRTTKKVEEIVVTANEESVSISIHRGDHCITLVQEFETQEEAPPK